MSQNSLLNLQLYRLLFIYFTAISCGQISNFYSPTVLNCGSLPSDGKYTKVLGLSGNELNSKQLEVFRLGTDGQLIQHDLTERGCFAVTPNSDFVLRSQSEGAALVTSSEQMEGVREVKLEKLSETKLDFDCESPFVTHKLNLADWVTLTSNQLSLYHLSWQFFTEGGMVNENSSLLNPQNLVGQRWPIPDSLPDGTYTIKIAAKNLLRNIDPETTSCSIVLDNQLPTVDINIEAPSNGELSSFNMYEPGSRINILGQDSSDTKIEYCWIEVSENEIETLDPEQRECELTTKESAIEVPNSGFWLLRYRAVDAAGNPSETQEQKIFSYNKLLIDQIKLLSENVRYNIDLLIDPLKGAHNALYTETLRRSLPTEFERNAALPFARQAVFNLLHKNIPYKTIELEDNAVTINVHPDDNSFIVGTDNLGLIYSFDADGNLRWKQNLNDIPDEEAFSNDGKLVALSGNQNKIRIFNYEDGEIVRDIDQGTATETIEFNSQDNRILTVGFNGLAYLYDLNSDAPISTLVTENKILRSGSWHPDGQSFVVSDPRYIYKYDFNGTPLPWGDGQSEVFDFVAFAGDSQVINSVYLNSGALLVSFTYNDSGIDGIATGVVLLNEQLQVISVAATPGNQRRLKLSPDKKSVVCYGNLFNGAIVYSNLDRVVRGQTRLTDVKVRIASISEPLSKVWWSQDSKQISARISPKQGVYVINKNGGVVQNFENLPNPGGRIGILKSHNYSVTANLKKKLQFWEIEHSPFRSKVFDGYIRRMDQNPDRSRTVVLETDVFSRGLKVKVLDQDFNTIESWPHPGPLLTELPFVGQPFLLLPTYFSNGFSKNQELVLGDLDGKVFLKDLQGANVQETIQFEFSRGTQITLPNSETRIIRMAAFAADDRFVAAGGMAGTVAFYERATGQFQYFAEAHEPTELTQVLDWSNQYVNKIISLGNGRFYSLGIDGRIIEWDAKTGSSRLVFDKNRSIYYFVPFSEDEILVSGNPTADLEVFDEGNFKFKLSTTPDEVLNPVVSQIQGLVNGVSTQGSAASYLWTIDGELLAEVDNLMPIDKILLYSVPTEGGFLNGGHNRIIEIPADYSLIYDKYCNLLQPAFRESKDFGISTVCSDLYLQGD